MLTDVITHVNKWIAHLSTKQISLDGTKVCPFAKNAVYDIKLLSESTIDLPSSSQDLLIYVAPQTLSADELQLLAHKFNITYPEFVFLPDHRDVITYIGDVTTNNGSYNLLLCQSRIKLNKARDILKNTSYYSYWNSNYLTEILNT